MLFFFIGYGSVRLGILFSFLYNDRLYFLFNVILVVKNHKFSIPAWTVD